jgi:hypothetical protein
LFLGDVINAAGVGMRNLSGGARLLPEAFVGASSRIRESLLAPQPLQALVLRFVENTTTAFANSPENAVRTNALGDFRHGGSGLHCV